MATDDLEKLLVKEGLLTEADLAEQQKPQAPPSNGDQPQSGYVTTGTDPDPCKHCHQPAFRCCPTCHGAYCEVCASILDPAYCKLCLTERDAEIEIKQGLTDEDGVTHEGRSLTPRGPFFLSTAKRISEMSDYELDAAIGHYKELIRQAEVAMDFRRTMKGGLELEKAQRDAVKRRQRRNYKMPGIKVTDPSKPKAKAKPETPSINGVKLDAMALAKLAAILKGGVKK